MIASTAQTKQLPAATAAAANAAAQKPMPSPGATKPKVPKGASAATSQAGAAVDALPKPSKQGGPTHPSQVSSQASDGASNIGAPMPKGAAAQSKIPKPKVGGTLPGGGTSAQPGSGGMPTKLPPASEVTPTPGGVLQDMNPDQGAEDVPKESAPTSKGSTSKQKSTTAHDTVDGSSKSVPVEVSKNVPKDAPIPNLDSVNYSFDDGTFYDTSETSVTVTGQDGDTVASGTDYDSGAFDGTDPETENTVTVDGWKYTYEIQFYDDGDSPSKVVITEAEQV